MVKLNADKRRIVNYIYHSHLANQYYILNEGDIQGIENAKTIKDFSEFILTRD